MSTCTTCGAPTERRAVRVRWTVRIALFGLTFAAAYFAVAPGMIGMLEGVQTGFAPAVPAAIATGVIALLAFLAGFLRIRRETCTACGAVSPAWLFASAGRSKASRPTADATPQTIAASGAHTDRRGFLAAAGAVGASGVATVAASFGGVLTHHSRWRDVGRDIFFAEVEKTAPTQHPEWAGSTVQAYRRLGRTEAMVSDISLGSGQIDDVKVALLALERGVNYFDTAPDYSRHGSELLLGEAIRQHGGRDKMFLATKFCTADGHLPIETPVADIMRAVEGSLERLDTDYVDLVHIHSCDRIERLMAPNFHEAFDRLKEQGKVRFLGVSTHTPNLEPVAHRAIDSGRFDVMMLAYHYGLWPTIGAIMDKAHAADVGVVAMKTLKGGKAAQLPGLDDQAVAYSQAAFRWVLTNPSVSCLVVSFSKPEHCDEYLFASGTAPRAEDVALLERYDQLASADYCRPHCGQCLDSCVLGLPIDTVLRYDMYFADYGRRETAREKYARLVRAGVDASACIACPAPCAGSCPFELPIRAKMVRAHTRLQAA